MGDATQTGDQRADLIDVRTDWDGPVTVAYVDDSEDDQFLASEALSATGRAHELRTVSSAIEMWTMLEQRIEAGEELPDVLVVDLKMPQVDGHQLLGALVSDRTISEVPMVVLTTSADHRDIERVEAAGPIRYLVKPSRFAELVETFDLILDLGERR
ncbi:MAG: response regulator [Actinomycetota bacterium]